MGEGEGGGDGSWKPWVLRSLMVGATAVVAGIAANGLLRSRAPPRRRVLGIIPARFDSSRFQGKPLALILGKPMIQRTWEQAKLATTLDSLVVATDDKRIAECCQKFGANVVLTSESCENGTERCKEAFLKMNKRFDLVINIQGDEPLIDPDVIDGVVKVLQEAEDAVMSTAVTALKIGDATDTKRVKCIVDKHGYAIYFSRGLIPFNKEGKVNPSFPYLLHLGIYCYDSEFLMLYPDLPSATLQLEEDLEQLKVLENGYKIKVVKVNHEAHGVDVPDDIVNIEQLLKKRNLP